MFERSFQAWLEESGMIKLLAAPALMLAIVFAAATANSGARDIIKGTDGDDVIFGDLAQFSGRGIGEPGGIHKILQNLDSRELMEIGKMLEGKNGIEGPDDDDDAIYGLAGSDIIFAQGGNDFIDAGPGADMVFAGSGNDLIVYDPADIWIDGGSGIDALAASPGCPSLRELQEGGNVWNIEMLLVSENVDIRKPLPGIGFLEGKVILDPNVWVKAPDATGVYVSRDNPESRLEIDPAVDARWIQ